MTAPASTVLLTEVKGDLANATSSSETPLGSNGYSSSAGDGINVLYFTELAPGAAPPNNGGVVYEAGVPGGYKCDGTNPTPPSTLTCSNGFSATFPKGRHSEGGIYALGDGHSKALKGGQVSAGGNAASSANAQNATTGTAPQAFLAAGTSNLGSFGVTYSLKVSS